MIRFLIVFLLLPIQCLANFNLQIQVRDIRNESPIKGVIVSFGPNSPIETRSSGVVRFTDVPNSALDAVLDLYHPNYEFNVKTICSSDYSVQDDIIFITIHGHERMENHYTMEAHIAKRVKTKQDSLYITVFDNKYLNRAILVNAKNDSIEMKRYRSQNHFSQKVAYDDIKTTQLVSMYSHSKPTRSINLAQCQINQDRIYIGPNLSFPEDGSELDLLKEYFAIRLKHADIIRKIKLDHRREINTLQDSISGLHDEIYFLKTGRRPEFEIAPPPPPEEPYPIEELIFFIHEKQSAEPEIGMSQLLMDIQSLLNEYTVKYSGDMLLRIHVDRSSAIRIEYPHISKEHHDLVPVITNYLNSQRWKHNPDSESQSIGITIKIKQKDS